jgi:hypothetical protein
MTPEEWERGTDPVAMVREVSLLVAEADHPARHHLGPVHLFKRMEALRRRRYDRSLRLFACACARRLWPLLGGPGRALVEASERYADRLIGPDALVAANQLAFRDAGAFPPPRGAGRAARRARAAAQARVLAVRAASCAWDGESAARAALSYAPRAAKRGQLHPRLPAQAVGLERQAQVALLREVLGNPLRPSPAIAPAVLADKGAARRLAAAIYEARRFEDLPVLADLLEEAGLTDAALLGHLRGPGPHARGCWALDAVLEKS